MPRIRDMLGAAALAAGVAAFALPAGAVEQRPILTLDMARTIADVCQDLAAERGWRPVNIAIMDNHNNLKHFRRMDDAFVGSIQIAKLKASSSAMLPFPTRTLGDVVAYGDPPRAPGIQHVPGLAVFAGGLPIVTADGTPIGSVGISGATSDEDEECAQAGIDAIADMLQ